MKTTDVYVKFETACQTQEQANEQVQYYLDVMRITGVSIIDPAPATNEHLLELIDDLVCAWVDDGDDTGRSARERIRARNALETAISGAKWSGVTQDEQIKMLREALTEALWAVGRGDIGVYKGSIVSLGEKALAATAAQQQEVPTAQTEQQPEPVHLQNARFSIDGAIELGKQGVGKPPSDNHWLMPYWQMGAELALHRSKTPGVVTSRVDLPVQLQEAKLREQLVALGWTPPEPTHQNAFKELVGHSMHELRTEELVPYLVFLCSSAGPRSAAFIEAASWVVSELERKTNDERVIAVELGKLRDRKSRDEAMGDQVMSERDHYHEVADKLADAIATYFQADIGEHSNANCPWNAALEVIGEAQPHVEYDFAVSPLLQEIVGIAFDDLLEKGDRLQRIAVRAQNYLEGRGTFQDRVHPWMQECFGAEISSDKLERNHRFFEEATELVQACGMTAKEAHQLVDYTFSRPVGEPQQEVGGVMVTLAALCLANGMNMHHAGEIELARIWTKVPQIRAKQANKPKHSPLPEAAGVSFEGDGGLTINFSREEWGCIFDGLMLEVSRSEGRKSANPESNSDQRVATCQAVLNRIRTEALISKSSQSHCSMQLLAEGKPSPRTCRICGLGPCTNKDIIKQEGQ